MLSYMKYIWNGQLNGPLPFFGKNKLEGGGRGGGVVAVYLTGFFVPFDLRSFGWQALFMIG